MTQFFRRLVGVLVLDAGAFEDIEADRRAGMQSVLVVMAVCLAGGFAAMGIGAGGPTSFVATAAMMRGAWPVWLRIIATVGTVTLREPQTSANVRELLRGLGYAAAPGVFLAFGAMPPAASIIAVFV